METKTLELENIIKTHDAEGLDFLEVGEGGTVLSKEKQKELLDVEVQTIELKVEEIPIWK